MLSLSGAKAQTLVLYHANGTTTDVQLYTQPRIEFKNDMVLITSPVLNMEYAKEDILRFTYKGNTTVGVGNLRQEADYSQENGQLVFHGVKQTDNIAVHNMNGVRVPVRLSFSGNDATLSLTSIPKGVYLLSVNGRTSKFTKQ
jgi:hypothetical protein